MIEEQRKTFRIQEGGTEEQIEFKNIKEGMTIKLYEPDNEVVVVNGRTQFEASSDAYLNESGYWCFRTLKENL